MSRRHRLISHSLALLLLWSFFAQVATAARETSITLDEPLHIASGYACLVTGDYRLVEEHPPLLKMLQAAPLLLANPRLPDPRTLPGWAESDLVAVAQHSVVAYRPIEPLVLAARVPTMLVGVLLGAVIYRWTGDLAGHSRRGRLGAISWGAPLLSLALFAFDPNMLAHAGVAATDLGAAAGIFAAAYTFWRWLADPSGPRWSRLPAVVVALGLALGIKNTALVLGPVFAVLVFAGRHRGTALRPYLVQGAAIAAGAFLVLWAGYRFEFGTVAGLPLPVLAPSHLLPLLRLRQHMESGHSAFLMGRNYHHADWRYFPIAFAVKTPLATLILVAWTIVRTIVDGRRRRLVLANRTTVLALLLLPVLYAAATLLSGINIGYRHLLPVLPFLYVVVGCGVALAGGQSISSPHRHTVARSLRAFGRHVVLPGLLVSYVTVTLLLHPWHLAYFNALAGGPDGGYRYLVDSNLDWGQTWKALRRYLDSRGIGEFYMSNYTINDPHAYGLNYDPLPPWPEAPPVLPQRLNPPPGIYAISSTQLQGVVVADPEMYDYFRLIEPVARIGHAMFVYEIAPHAAISWVAQCTVPVAPLSVDQLREGLGLGGDVPILPFDCSQSWIIPPGHGRYVLARTQSGSAWPAFAKGRLAYEQKITGSVPPFSVYEWDPHGMNLAPPVRFEPPISVGESLDLLGYAAQPVATGDVTWIETWWRILAPPTQALSLMVHLVGQDGQTVAVGDGLGVAVEQWIAGSLLVQRHRLSVPASAAPGIYTLHLGAYTFPDLARLPVAGAGSSAQDYVTAGPLEVRAP